MSGRRFHLNVVGPFYVEDGRCITCGAPEAEAPGLMASDEATGHCYFERQPETPDELEQAIRAVHVSCCEGVRYGGDDPAILARLDHASSPPSPVVPGSLPVSERAHARSVTAGRAADDETPEPLPVARILRRAVRLAARPVAVSWMLGHVVCLYLLVASASTVLQPERWPASAHWAWAIGWWTMTALLAGTASGGVAIVGWAEHMGETATLGACARAIAARAARVAWESVRVGGVAFVGLWFVGVGALWVIAANCAIVPSCVCDHHLPAKEAADRGFRMIVGNQTRSLAMHALVTPLALGVALGAARLGLLLAGSRVHDVLFRMAVSLASAGLMTGACVYAVLGAATFIELRSARLTGAEIARTFE